MCLGKMVRLCGSFMKSYMLKVPLVERVPSCNKKYSKSKNYASKEHKNKIYN